MSDSVGRVQVGVRLPAELVARLDACARASPLPADRSGAIEAAIVAGLPEIERRLGLEGRTEAPP